MPAQGKKFRAAVAFYPPCRGFRGNVTIPTLILIGERDDVTPAADCRDLVEGARWRLARCRVRARYFYSWLACDICDHD